MSISTVFIPCAGKGTRMGEVGRKIPKPLWPVFEKSMLELQIAYFKRLGFKEFIINTHHLAEQFEYLSGKVKILHESELLGSGGSLHNLKRSFPSLGKVLVSNPDVLFDMSEKDWETFLKNSEKEDRNNSLLGLDCRAGESYNELVVSDNNYFKEVKTPPVKDYCTYSGIGVIDLNSFDICMGESSFFETVVNSKFNQTKLERVGQRDCYWDFGTLPLYVESLLRVIQEDRLDLRATLLELGVFDERAIYLKERLLSVGCLEINLDSEEIQIKD